MRCSEPATLSEVERKAIHPISLAALIFSIPSTSLAVWDIADRIRKRRKAQAVIDAVKQLKAEKQVDVYLLAPNDQRPLVASLNPDQLLDLVRRFHPSPAKPE